MRSQFRRALGIAVACLLLASALPARAADDYPNHAVRWLVGYPPGGSTDICARLVKATGATAE
jgi:tripartite-type tricarboxylate transporter receptor subunit TctC